ncbi:MAG TPA: hypothetical protein PLG56_13630, partial [Lacunisphaera sp.]|nr:hypothetical protein [Lacunisphaera sp.]
RKSGDVPPIARAVPSPADVVQAAALQMDELSQASAGRTLTKAIIPKKGSRESREWDGREILDSRF